MKKILSLGKVLSRDEAKKVVGGGYDTSECSGYTCTYGAKCFYSNWDGCGYATCDGPDGHGGCNWL